MRKGIPASEQLPVALEALKLGFGLTPQAIDELGLRPGDLTDLRAYMRACERTRQKVHAELEIMRSSLRRDGHPVVLAVHSRTKELSSVLEKLLRRKAEGKRLSYTELTDLCGARVIVSYLDDVYNVVDYLAESRNLDLMEVEDKILKPMESGYRGVHLLVRVLEEPQLVSEIQVRTDYQDSWSVKAHELVYKRVVPDEFLSDLRNLGEALYQADLRSCSIRSRLEARARGEDRPDDFKLVDEPRLQMRFIPQGTVVGNPEFPIRKNRIYLDVGNRLQPGVLDHHHEGAGFGSAADIVVQRPGLVLASVGRQAREVEMFLHDGPDFDACASSYLAWHLIRQGALPAGAAALAAYATEVDQGLKSLDPNQIQTPFAAFNFLAKLFSNDSKNHRNDRMWKAGWALIENLLGSLQSGVEADHPHSLDWDREPLTLILPLIKQELALYREDVERAHLTRVVLPSRDMLRWEPVDAIFIEDPQCSLFKYWARRDTDHSPSKKGFALTLVTYTRWNRTIIATDPSTDWFLAHLGSLLEMEESLERRSRGGDSRLGEADSPKPLRFGHNPDPWYDGRGHAFTIVDSPREGSLLSAERIREIVVGYASGRFDSGKPGRPGSPLE